MKNVTKWHLNEFSIFPRFWDILFQKLCHFFIVESVCCKFWSAVTLLFPRQTEFSISHWKEDENPTKWRLNKLPIFTRFWDNSNQKLGHFLTVVRGWKWHLNEIRYYFTNSVNIFNVLLFIPSYSYSKKINWLTTIIKQFTKKITRKLL